MTLSILPRDFNAEFKPEFLVTNSEPLDNNYNFTDDGVFSNTIFGNMSNGIDYSCSCRKYEGEFNKGYVCEICNTEVTYRGLHLSREGWIDLHHYNIHPLLYRYITKIIPESTLKGILEYKGKVSVEGTITESEMTYPYNGIGLMKFQANFNKIIDDFYNRKKDKTSRMFEYQLLNAFDNYIFINKFPIINSKLRPAIVIGEEFSFDKINNYYNALIKNSNTLKELSTIEQNPIIIGKLVEKNQYLLDEVYKHLVRNIGTKDGFIRMNLFGNRLNYTSRSVIVPLPVGYSMNDIIIPYHTAIELLKPCIIHKLCKLKRISIYDANKMCFNATLKFDKYIYQIMKELIQEENIRLILNRNPTIRTKLVVVKPLELLEPP